MPLVFSSFRAENHPQRITPRLTGGYSYIALSEQNCIMDTTPGEPCLTPMKSKKLKFKCLNFRLGKSWFRLAHQSIFIFIIEMKSELN